MKENNQRSKRGVVISKQEFHVLASSKLEAKALKEASRALAGRSHKSLFELPSSPMAMPSQVGYDVTSRRGK